MNKYIMAIDQGTTSSRVVIMNQVGSLVASGSAEFKQIFPQAGWVEHDPEEIWKSVQVSARKALEQAKISSQDIAAIGITNQRETVVAFRKSTGEVLYNAIVWQCRRTTKMCELLRKKYAQKIKAKTGLVLDPYFSASKMRWMIENVDAVKKALKEKDLAFGNIDTFLMWKLSNHRIFATDVSNASRTMLMNLKTGSWDAELLKLFKVPLECLPEIKSSSGLFGEAQGLDFVKDKTPITGVAGDQQAALFGQACFSVGESKCTFGTGSFILMNTGSQFLKSKSGLLSTVAWKLGNEKIQYALEGGAFICGAAVGWLRDGLELFAKSSEVEQLASKVDHTDGVEFVPALTGLGAPHWKPNARGELTGLTRGTTKAHVARATLEAMALQNADILLAMQKDLKKKLKRLRVDGGASANNLLMQMQADYLMTTVDRPEQVETTATGACYLAGLGVGLWKNVEEIRRIWKKDREFNPQLSNKAVAQRRVSWEKAIRKASI
jgi:glycerol kinase